MLVVAEDHKMWIKYYVLLKDPFTLQTKFTLKKQEGMHLTWIQNHRFSYQFGAQYIWLPTQG